MAFQAWPASPVGVLPETNMGCDTIAAMASCFWTSAQSATGLALFHKQLATAAMAHNGKTTSQSDYLAPMNQRIIE